MPSGFGVCDADFFVVHGFSRSMAIFMPPWGRFWRILYCGFVGLVCWGGLFISLMAFCAICEISCLVIPVVVCISAIRVSVSSAFCSFVFVSIVFLMVCFCV